MTNEEKIYNIALKEMPDKLHIFHNERAIMYRGFKVSLTDEGEYHWYDTRFSNYYERVDPLITEKVLANGFALTLTQVMLHSDEEKILSISRDIEIKKAMIAYWVRISAKEWHKLNAKLKLFRTKKEREKLNKQYEVKKKLHAKKRRVLQEEIFEMKEEIKFFKSRVKLYNKYKFKQTYGT